MDPRLACATVDQAMSALAPFNNRQRWIFCISSGIRKESQPIPDRACNTPVTGSRAAHRRAGIIGGDKTAFDVRVIDLGDEAHTARYYGGRKRVRRSRVLSGDRQKIRHTSSFVKAGCQAPARAPHHSISLLSALPSADDVRPAGERPPPCRRSRRCGILHFGGAMGAGDAPPRAPASVDRDNSRQPDPAANDRFQIPAPHAPATAGRVL